MSSRLHFAITAPGLESVCAAELRALGEDGKVLEGGVEWEGDDASLYRANLRLRCASRIVSRLGTFRARGFPELERHAGRIAWTDLLRPGTRVALRVVSRKSRLYHEGAIAERLSRVLADRADITVSDTRRSDDDDAADDALLVLVRVLRDEFTLSLDASGRLLHQRGYRREIARAPLRETLAAAMLLAIGWDVELPLLDPMCGSGTIPIEAALIARRIAPGLANAERKPRAYAFEQWRTFADDVWRDVVAQARSEIREHTPAPIRGSDRHAGALAAARANAARAGVQNDVELAQLALAALEPPPGTGVILTNPPYGVRVGERTTLHGVYAELGAIARQRFPGWTLGLLAADARLVAATGLPLEDRFATRNGGIDVRLLAARVPGGSGTRTAPAGTTAVDHGKDGTR